MWKIRQRGSRAKILVGHGLDHDLACLGVEYPSFMLRLIPYTKYLYFVPFNTKISRSLNIKLIIEMITGT